MQSTGAWMAALAALLLSTFQAHPVSAGEPGFNEPREQVLAEIRRVGFLPTELAYDWPRGAAAAAELEELAAGVLAEAGIESVPLSAYDEIEMRIRREEGGWYDPMSGRTLEEKRISILEKTRSELAATHQLDGFVKVWVDVVQARVSGTEAAWHGVREPAKWPIDTSSLGKLLDNSTGTLPALSVTVSVFRKGEPGKLLFGIYSGLQLLSMVREQRGKTEFIPVADDFILSDPVRNSRAVRNSLLPLIKSAAEIKAESKEFRKRREAAVKASGDRKQLRDEQGRPLASPVLEEDPPPAEAQPAALRVSRQEFAERAAVIALAPVSMISGRRLPDRSEVVEAAMVAGLEAAGYRIVPSSAFLEIYSQRRAAMGPYFDTVTGDALTERLAALDAAVLADLRAQHGATAILHPSIQQVSAAHDGGTVRWDGVTQSLAQGGNAIAKLSASTAWGYAGTVPAISLRVRIVGEGGVEYFQKRTGLQTLERISAGLLQKLVEVKDEQILADPQALGQSVEILLDELLLPVESAVSGAQ